MVKLIKGDSYLSADDLMFIQQMMRAYQYDLEALHWKFVPWLQLNNDPLLKIAREIDRCKKMQGLIGRIFEKQFEKGKNENI